LLAGRWHQRSWFVRFDRQQPPLNSWLHVYQFHELAIDAALPDTTDVSDAIITDNKFFNAGIVQFSNSSADSTSVYGPKNITFNNNILEDTRTIFTLTRGVTFSGNTLSNSTTTQILVQLTDCRDFLASGNQLIGGGYGFYMQSANLPTASTNNINIAINGNLLRNQFNAGIRFQTPQAINCSAKNNTIIAQTGLVSASWDGILVKEDCTVEENNIYAEAGLNGINMAPGATGGYARALRNTDRRAKQHEQHQDCWRLIQKYHSAKSRFQSDHRQRRAKQSGRLQSGNW
jgi:hypothetical protein